MGGADARERAQFWEIWHKGERRVLWVAKGVEDILDEDDPHLDLCNFFPCPKPAYGCTQRGVLIPVPDVMQYRDQLERTQPAHQPHSSFIGISRGEGVLSGGRCGDCRGGADRGADAHAGRADGAGEKLGGVWRHERSHCLAADRADCVNHHRAGGAAQTDHRGYLSNHGA